ncbi:hypothetical protein D1872_228290 [compost metagenome]
MATAACNFVVYRGAEQRRLSVKKGEELTIIKEDFGGLTQVKILEGEAEGLITTIDSKLIL